jgi:hypothetical protein
MYRTLPIVVLLAAIGLMVATMGLTNELGMSAQAVPPNGSQNSFCFTATTTSGCDFSMGDR